jgi:hypothetical protein
VLADLAYDGSELVGGKKLASQLLAVLVIELEIACQTWFGDAKQGVNDTCWAPPTAKNCTATARRARERERETIKKNALLTLFRHFRNRGRCRRRLGHRRQRRRHCFQQVC